MLNVEKVVNPPQNPVPSSSNGNGCAAWCLYQTVTRPSRNDPATLIANVCQGKPGAASMAAGAYRFASRATLYRAADPTAPPAITASSQLSSVRGSITGPSPRPAGLGERRNFTFRPLGRRVFDFAS